MADKLTDKQKRFCDEYLIDLNATQAYQRVYNCKESTARINASKLLTKTNISEYINNKRKRLEVKSEWTKEQILNDIKKIATNENNEVRDRLRAYELGGKTLGMFTDKVEAINHNLNQDVSNLSDDELDRELERLRK